MTKIFQAIGIIIKLGAVKNWKTTSIGLIGSVAMVLYDNLTRGVTDWKSIAMASIPVIAGILAKDADVSSGGEQKTITAATITTVNTDLPESPK